MHYLDPIALATTAMNHRRHIHRCPQTRIPGFFLKKIDRLPGRFI
jgi:hypothetical protein